MWDCLAQSTHKQRLAADRIAHIKGAQTESLEHHNLLQGAQGIRLRVINEAQHPVAQKLTRPDGEIRAGRVDRRRGSGGRERRSGLNSGLDGPFAY
jgi:hypothetical protein